MHLDMKANGYEGSDIHIHTKENGYGDMIKPINIFPLAGIVRLCPNLDISWSFLPMQWEGRDLDDNRVASDLISVVRSTPAWRRLGDEFVKMELDFENTWSLWHVIHRALTLRITLKANSTAAWWANPLTRFDTNQEILRCLGLWKRARSCNPATSNTGVREGWSD